MPIGTGIELRISDRNIEYSAQEWKYFPNVGNFFPDGIGKQMMCHNVTKSENPNI